VNFDFDFTVLALLVLALPLLASAFGVFLALRGGRPLARMAGVLLSLVGIAESVAIVVWWQNYCWETWQPCGPAPAMALSSVWAGLALVILIALAGVAFLSLSGRKEPQGTGSAGQ
jgi:glycerol-3-phosphate acyltransferase PlsY